jgi:Chaperone of endosialidase
VPHWQRGRWGKQVTIFIIFVIAVQRAKQAESAPMKTNTLSLILASLLTGFAFLQPSPAVVPPPDGGYPGFNTAEGQNALSSRTTGVANTAVGWNSLFGDTTASFNTGVGTGTLLSNNGDSNTAVGAAALLLNTTGSENTAVGTAALVNSNADANAAFGAFALNANTSGIGNTAIGVSALKNNTSGNFNTATGDAALVSSMNGALNTAIGVSALSSNTTGGSNIGLGVNAGINVSTASGVACIQSDGGNVDNTTWIGNIYAVTTQSGTTAPVIVSNDGQLGTVVSSERFKKDIATMDEASEIILSLRPVTFHYKSDARETPQFGLIAEEVAKVNPALVLPDKQGKPYTVRYEAVNAMLLNEFLKEHKAFVEEQRKVQEQGATISRLEQQIEALTAGLQKVSAQLELNKPAPQTVLNNQ